jgi:hypothetical protein
MPIQLQPTLNLRLISCAIHNSQTKIRLMYSNLNFGLRMNYVAQIFPPSRHVMRVQIFILNMDTLTVSTRVRKIFFAWFYIYLLTPSVTENSPVA